MSGTPSTLHTFRSDFLPSTSTTSRFTSLHALYHSPELTTVKDAIISDLDTRSICFPTYSDLTRRLSSTVTGQVIDGSNRSEGQTLLEEIIDMILLHPVNFDFITAAINDEHLPSTSPRSLVNLGPGNVLWRSIARSCAQVPFTMVDWSAASEPPIADSISPTIPEARNGASQREPIAIVGMAVKFPQADNAEELWRILEQGLNTVSEVRFP